MSDSRGSLKEYESILPSDKKLLKRRHHFGEIMEKYLKIGEAGVSESVENIEKLISDEEYLDNLGSEKESLSESKSSTSKNDNEDEDLNFETILNNTLCVVKKRKENWIKTGIDAIMDDFSNTKVESWLKTNSPYMNSKFHKPKITKNMDKKDLRNSDKINYRYFKTKSDLQLQSNETTTSSDSDNVYNYKRILRHQQIKFKYNKELLRKKTRSSVLNANKYIRSSPPLKFRKYSTVPLEYRKRAHSEIYNSNSDSDVNYYHLYNDYDDESLESVDTAKYILSNKKKRKVTKRKYRTIKDFCEKEKRTSKNSLKHNNRYCYAMQSISNGMYSGNAYNEHLRSHSKLLQSNKDKYLLPLTSKRQISQISYVNDDVNDENRTNFSFLNVKHSTQILQNFDNISSVSKEYEETQNRKCQQLSEISNQQELLSLDGQQSKSLLKEQQQKSMSSLQDTTSSNNNKTNTLFNNSTVIYSPFDHNNKDQMFCETNDKSILTKELLIEKIGEKSTEKLLKNNKDLFNHPIKLRAYSEIVFVNSNTKSDSESEDLDPGPHLVEFVCKTEPNLIKNKTN